MPVPKLYNFCKEIKDEGILIILQKVALINRIKEIQFALNSIAYHSSCISTVSYDEQRKSKRHNNLQHFGSSSVPSPTFQLERLAINFGIINFDFVFSNTSAWGACYQLRCQWLRLRQHFSLRGSPLTLTSSTSPSTLCAFQLEGLTINFIIDFIFTTNSDLGDPQQHPHLCHLH